MSFRLFLLRNWRLKAAALALAVLLWATIRLRDDEPLNLDVHDVAVQVSEGLDAGWALVGPPSPAAVRITLTGSQGDLFRAGMARPVIVVPADSVPGEDWVPELNPDWVRNIDRSRVAVGDIVPSTVRLRFERNASQWIPVSVRYFGALPDGIALAGDPDASPLLVRVHGRASAVDTLQAVFTEPFDLGLVEASGEFTVALDTIGLLGLSIAPATATLAVGAGAREQRVLGPVAVDMPVAGLVAEPGEVSVTLYGEAGMLEALDPASLRLRISMDPAVMRAQAGRGPVRLPVELSGLPRWVEAEMDADSVTVRETDSVERTDARAQTNSGHEARSGEGAGVQHRTNLGRETSSGEDAGVQQRTNSGRETGPG